MRRFTAQTRLVTLLGLLVFWWSTAYAQITPSADSYINTADSTTNYGAKTLLDVDGASQITYVQFNLASLPATARISQATLKLYVNSVTTAGSFNVDYVNGAWLEGTIDSSNAPPLGTTIASNVNVTTADKNQYILINVTSAVQAWLSGSETNNGIALVANSTFNATFDSKENTTTSHAPELDIAFAGSRGTITGVTTTAQSGLTGGGTSGTLNLSLTNACATNQVLQWNGSAWACSNAGTGTVTGVTAGTDLTGGGSSGNLTLNLDTTKVPLLAAANTFTGNQAVNGNLSATGMLTGSGFQIGSNLFDYGSYSNANAFTGFAGNTATTGTYNTASGVLALGSNTAGIENTAIGYGALQGNTAASANTAIGYGALQSNSGNFNTASGVGALYFNTTGYQNTATGVAALYFNTTGFYNTAAGLSALRNNTTGSFNTASGDGALTSNTTGTSNTASGYMALSSNTTGSYSTAVGAGALQNSISSPSWIFFPSDAFGYQALYNNTDGTQNAAFGYQAGYSNAGGFENSAFGYQALYSNAGGCIPSNPPCQFYGHYNSAFGAAALYNTNCGNPCTASGTAIGNSAFGNQALFSNTSGSYNTAVGYMAVSSNTTGTSLTCIGAQCSAPGNISNATAIGAHAVVEQSNSLVLGGTGRYAVKVGIGTTTPSNVLTIAQGAGHPVSDSWETYSSRRWKTNIQTLPNALAKVQQLRGVSYDLKDSGKHEIGVIAEEVGAVVPELVSYEANGKDARSVDYARLTALLIEATKQQQRELQHLRSELRETRQSLRNIKAQMSSTQPTLTVEKAGARSPKAMKQWKGARAKTSAHEVATTSKP